MQTFKICVACIMFVFAACKSTKQVDTIVHNGHVYTVNEKFELAEAFAIKDGKIVAIGSSNKILEEYTGRKYY